MLMERNTLMEYVYPKIKEYCREKHGLEYQVVDMRWGVRDEMTDEHMTTVRGQEKWKFTLCFAGPVYERADGLPEVQHGAKLHLLRSTEVSRSSVGVCEVTCLAGTATAPYRPRLTPPSS